MSTLLEHYEPYEAVVACSGESHRLRWEAGVVVALDHDSPDGERALAALAGERCPCIDLLDRWDRHADDLRVLVLTSRGATDPVHWLAAPPRQVQSAHASPGGWMGFAATSQPPASGDELVELLSVDAGLARRLAATAAATWIERLHHDDPRVGAAAPALTAALSSRVVCAVRQWTGSTAADVRVQPVPSDERPSLQRIPDGLRVAVPHRWLVDVWGRGLAVVGDRLALGLVDVDAQRITLSTVDQSFGPLRPLTLSLG